MPQSTKASNKKFTLDTSEGNISRDSPKKKSPEVKALEKKDLTHFYKRLQSDLNKRQKSFDKKVQAK